MNPRSDNYFTIQKLVEGSNGTEKVRNTTGQRRKKNVGLKGISFTSNVSWSWSYKQNLSKNLRYAHFRALLLVENVEQPIRMLKNEHSVILWWKYLYRFGPWYITWRSIVSIVSSALNCPPLFGLITYKGKGVWGRKKQMKWTNSVKCLLFG